MTDWWQVLAWVFVLYLLGSLLAAALIGQFIRRRNRPEPRASKRLIQLKERKPDRRR